MTTTTAATDQPREFRLPKPALVAITVLLLMPFGMSSWFLLGFAEGLGLPWVLRPILPLTFDAAAVLLVSMTVFAAWRFRERAGLLKPLTWLFVGGSAALNYLHGVLTLDVKYDQYIFATVSILGPAMFEVVLAKSRRWLRKEANEVGFGMRWLLAPAETFRAWRLGILDGISSAAEALRHLRLRTLLDDLPEDERVDYALGALDGATPGRAHDVRVWLHEHGIAAVSGDTLRAVIARRGEQQARDIRGELEAAAVADLDLRRRQIEVSADRQLELAAEKIGQAQEIARREQAAREQAEGEIEQARELAEQASRAADAARAELLQEQGARRQAETAAATVKAGAEELLAARVMAETEARLARQDADQARARLAVLEAAQQAAAASAAARPDQSTDARDHAPADTRDGNGGRRVPRALTATERRRVRAAHARGEAATAIAERTGIAVQPIRAYVRELDAKQATGRRRDAGEAHAPPDGLMHASVHASERAPTGAPPVPLDDRQPSMNGAVTTA